MIEFEEDAMAFQLNVSFLFDDSRLTSFIGKLF